MVDFPRADQARKCMKTFLRAIGGEFFESAAELDFLALPSGTLRSMLGKTLCLRILHQSIVRLVIR